MSKPIIAVAFYSTYGHIGALAEEVIAGCKAAGAEVRPYFIQEILPKEVLEKMHAGSSLSPKYPILKPDDLREVDGLLLGAPTRYGRMPAAVSSFFDACGGLWQSKALSGKFASVFTSTATPQGGQETTALTTIPFFTHQGMCYVPLGYSHSYIGDYSDGIHGGSPWGASMMAGGMGERQPQKGELELAHHQGKYFSEFVGTYVRGKSAMAKAQTGVTHGSDPGTAPALAAPVDSHKAVPQTQEKDGYAVPTETKSSAPAETQPSTAASPAPEPAHASTTSAPADPTPAATSTPAHPHTEKKNKGGFFSCCSGKNID